MLDLRDYLRVLRRGWAIILALVVLGLAGGIGVTLATTKLYRASVQIFVATSTTSNATDLSQGNAFAQERVQSYTSIANSPDVTNAVIKQLGLKLTGEQLADEISADAPLNKVLINIHVTDHDPRRAATLANAVANVFSFVVQRTEQTDANGKPVVKLTVIHPATVPKTPVEPNQLLNIGLGLVLGILVGVGVVILRDVLDNTVKQPSDFEELGVAVLGMVPFDKRAAKTPIAFRSDPHSARSEAYRQLRTNLQFVDVDNPPKLISVTSAVPGEGKTMTALNLAAAMAEAGARVCLVEADLRRPSLANALGLIGDVGFTTVLIGKARVESVLQNAGRNLAVLTSGAVPPNPSELLLTAHARDIIRELAEQVDFVVVDTPPLLPVTDAATIATIVDATLVVHRAGKTGKEQAARCVEALEKVGKRPVGAILNMITRNGGGSTYEYGYYYTYEPANGSEQPTPTEARHARLEDNPPITGDATSHPDPTHTVARANGNPPRRPQPVGEGVSPHAGHDAPHQPLGDTSLGAG